VLVRRRRKTVFFPGDAGVGEGGGPAGDMSAWD
jgi:hypothetical protein